jgi:hypothetical protein
MMSVIGRRDALAFFGLTIADGILILRLRKSWFRPTLKRRLRPPPARTLSPHRMSMETTRRSIRKAMGRLSWRSVSPKNSFCKCSPKPLTA